METTLLLYSSKSNSINPAEKDGGGGGLIISLVSIFLVGPKQREESEKNVRLH